MSHNRFICVSSVTPGKIFTKIGALHVLLFLLILWCTNLMCGFKIVVLLCSLSPMEYHEREEILKLRAVGLKKVNESKCTD